MPRGGARGRRIGRRGRGRGNRGATPDASQQDPYLLKAAKDDAESVNDVMDNLPALFTTDSSFKKHFTAQEKDFVKYAATLITLQKAGTEILQSAKARTLAAAWARKDHALADALLADRQEFGLVEVLKAATLLDAGRQVREAEKRLKRLQMQPKVKATKLAKVKTTIHNLQAIQPSVGSLSGAICRRIHAWVRTIPEEELQFYALHLPKDPWKKLADLVHFNPKADFKLGWFLPYCFGTAAPEDSVVTRCAELTDKTVEDLLAVHNIPYAHLKGLKVMLSDRAKELVARAEKSLDTLVWNYEDLSCPLVDGVIAERLRAGETIRLPYGKVMERLLIIREMRQNNSAKEEETSVLYDHLITMAEKLLATTQLTIDSPVAVIGDRSPSMGTAIKTSTIIASLLSAIANAELSFFSNRNYVPPEMPRTIEEVLHLASTLNTEGSTIPAASLLPYYTEKKVVKTFVMVTDEEENGGVKCDGETYRFHTLFKKYTEEVYPAKLVFVSFLAAQHSRGQMVSQLEGLGFSPLQFKLSNHRPDLLKLGNLLGLLSREARGFADEVAAAERDIREDGLGRAMEKLKLTE